MPYYPKGKCVYKKDTDKKVGCTKGPVKKYLAALYAAENKKKKLKESQEEDLLDFKSVLPDPRKKYDYLVTYSIDSQNDLVIGHKNEEAETVFLHRLGDIVHGKSNIVLAQIGSKSSPATGPYSKNTRSILKYNLPKLSKQLKTPKDVESFLSVFVDNSYQQIEQHKEDEGNDDFFVDEPDKKAKGIEESLQFEALFAKIIGS